MANLKPIGRILGVIGGILMIIFAILVVINELVSGILGALEDFTFTGVVSIGGDAIGELAWLVGAVILVVCGIVAIYGYKDLDSKDTGKLLIWGIIFIVLGIIAFSLPGILLIVGGIVLIIDYFI